MNEQTQNTSSIHGGCREVWQKWSGFLDGELAPDEKARVAEHLKCCSHCNEYVNSQGSFNRLLTHTMVEHCCGSVSETLRVKVLTALEKNFGPVAEAPLPPHKHSHSHDHDHHHHHDHSHGHPHDHHHHDHEHGLASMGAVRTVRVPMYALVMLALACTALGAGGAALVMNSGRNETGVMNARVKTLAERAGAMMKAEIKGADEWNAYAKKHGEMFPALAMPKMGEMPTGFAVGTMAMQTDADALALVCSWDANRRYVLITCPGKAMSDAMPSMDRGEFKVDDKFIIVWRDKNVYRALVTTADRGWAHQQVAALTK